MKCLGVVTSEDPREAPLRRCGELRTRGTYCDYHASQRERQDALLRYLKIGWDKAMKAARGRPRNPEPEIPSVDEVEEALQKRSSEKKQKQKPVEEVDYIRDADARRRMLKGE